MRVQLGLTQTDLVAGVASTALLSRIENGKRTPNPDLLEHIAARLGSSPAGLLAEADAAGRAWEAHLVAVAASGWLNDPLDAGKYQRFIATVDLWEQRSRWVKETSRQPLLEDQPTVDALGRPHNPALPALVPVPPSEQEAG